MSLSIFVNFVDLDSALDRAMRELVFGHPCKFVSGAIGESFCNEN